VLYLAKISKKMEGAVRLPPLDFFDEIKSMRDLKSASPFQDNFSSREKVSLLQIFLDKKIALSF
jgi:hypothetical protein